MPPPSPSSGPAISSPSTPAPVGSMDLPAIAAARELFWHNVMREILTSLSVACLGRRQRDEGDTSPPTEEEALFDGRLAVLTRGGERVAIADVFPLFACGINTDDEHRALSVAVECTVFQVRTPDGQVFTLPLHEIRGFHALTPELMRRLEQLASEQAGEEESERLARPFGFAAFAPRPKDPYYPPPSGVTPASRAGGAGGRAARPIQ